MIGASTLLVLAAASPAATPPTSSLNWQTAATQGSFVVIGALISYLSTRASDHRRLTRDDERQWNDELKASYVVIAAAVTKCHLEIGRIHASSVEERLAAVMPPAEEAMVTIQREVRLLELIGQQPVIEAAKAVQMQIAEIWQAGLVGPTGDSDENEYFGQSIWLYQKLKMVDARLEDLRAHIRSAIRVEPLKRARKKTSRQ